MNELRLEGPRFRLAGWRNAAPARCWPNGVEIRSCVTPSRKSPASRLPRFEGLPALYAQQKGLAQTPALHPLQQAFIDEQSLHCGYCYNGMTIKGAELLSGRNPKPTDAQIRAHMDGHLCRCGTYPRVMKAIKGGGPSKSRGERDETDIPERTSRSRAATCSRAAAPHHRLQPVGLPSPASAARGDVAGPARSQHGRHLDRESMPTTRRRSISESASSARATLPASPDRGRRARSRHEPAQGGALDTNVAPDQGSTSSSSSIHRGGRAAARGSSRSPAGRCASARRCGLACQMGSLAVSKGIVSVDGEAGGRSVKVWRPPRRQAVQCEVPRHRAAEPVNRYALVGKSVSRVDIPDKVAASTSTCIICARPTCCMAAWCLPRGQRAFGAAPAAER